MEVIDHAPTGVKLYAGCGQCLAVQVALLVRFADEARLAIVAALRDVQRHVITVKSRAARHAEKPIASQSAG